MGRINKASKVIPLRDITDIKVLAEVGTSKSKEWRYAFNVETREREYILIAQTWADKEMWVHAFNTILKYKNKAKEIQRQPTDQEDGKFDEAVEDEGFDESEGEADDERGHRERQPARDNRGDFMEADPRQLQSKKMQQNHSDSGTEGHSNSREPPSDEEEEDKQLESFPKVKETSMKETKIISKKKITMSKKGSVERKQERLTEEEKLAVEKERMRNEYLNKQREDQEYIPRQKDPLPKRRHSPEVVEDESPRSDDSEPEEKSRPQPNKGKKSKKPENVKNVAAKRSNNEVDDVDIDVDAIVKTGPKQTIKLDMPSPREEAQDPSQTLPYFNGFIPKKKERHERAEKPKPVIKPKNIVKMDKNEDLLSRWEKKYGKKEEVLRDEWGNEIKPHSQEIPKKKPKEEIMVKKKHYVENVLASQPVANGEDFEENWDEDEGSPIAGSSVNKENSKYRHPDIPDQEPKPKKKKGKKKMNKSKIKAPPAPTPDEDFEMDWDE